MSALQNGTAVVRNGSATVFHVWTLVVPSCALVVGEAITWGADGTGFFLSYEPVLRHARIYRTSGVLPAVGTVISGAVASITVSQLGPGTPGNWTSGSVGPNPTYFHVSGIGVPYIVQTLSATDKLVLTAPWTDADYDEVPYSITQDYTVSFGIPLVALGDIDSATVLSLALQKIDTTLYEMTQGTHFDLPTSAGASGTLFNDSGFVKVSP
jgi:hypothetical protein